MRAVPRALATNVRGGSEHDIDGGRQTMTIGETPGARIAGLLDAGAAGHGNCAALMVVPRATWMVSPFWDGVTVIDPCAVLGAGADGVDGGCGAGDGGCVGTVEGVADGDGALDVVPGPFPESGAEADEEDEAPEPGAVPEPAS